MPRYALKIEYDGGPFAGWQRQSQGQASVQGAVEDALARIAPGPHTIAGAGRTDAGVHATGQVATVDLDRAWDPFRLSEALNWHLKPAPISILQAALVDDGFHARFSAVERRYLFRLIARRAPVTLDRGKVWQVSNPLDAEKMQKGALYLIGQHDFTTFRSVMCQSKSPVKTLDHIGIETRDYPGGTEYRFVLRARSFLHNQVRSIVGTLERVGAGRWTPEDVRDALLSRDRSACGPVCPPDGLYLTDAVYPIDPFRTG